MVDMLTRKEVEDQLSSITKQVNSGYGVKGGANKTTALEDAYAYWLAANQDRVKMKDFADFLQLDADAAQNAYLPEGGFGYRDVVDFDEIDFEGIAGPPPKGYTGDINYESIQDDNFDALFDRIDAARTASPFVRTTRDIDPEAVEDKSIYVDQAEYMPGGTYAFTPPTPAQDFRNISMNDYATVADLAAQDKIAQGLFNPLSFNTRDITRGTPAVTRGLDAQGNPTTAITMGDTTATGTGPNIGQLTTDLTFPSTGMGINADGTGTVTTGTLDTTGNIVKLDPDVTGVNLLQSGAGNTSTMDPNAITGGNVTVNQPSVGLPPSSAPTQPAMPQPATPAPAATPQPAMPPVAAPTPAKTQAQVIQDLFNSSPTKDVAAIRIGDYARSVGGITAQEIADAVQPIVGGRPDFGIGAFEAGTGGSEVLKAVADGGYGGGFITETADQISAPQQTYNTLAQQQQQLRSGFGDDQRVGDADYTPQEAAYRMLDFAKRNNMSLDQAAQSFGLTEADARQRAGQLDIDLGQFGFNQGGGVTEPTNAYEEFSMSMSMGPEDISMQRRQQGVQNLMNSRTGIQPSEKMLSALDRIMGRENG
jgi:hypothetical protein